MFRSIKNSGEVLSKLNSKGFHATSLSTYDFSTLYTTFSPQRFPHNQIKEKLLDLIERAFKKIFKTNFLIKVKLVLISDTYCIFILAIPLLLPHKKGTN